MTFIHVADVHLGIAPDSDKPWSADRGYDIKETFYNVIKKCDELKANLLLISGDLFHRQPLTSDLNEINEQFKTIPNTKVVIIAGNSDKIRKNSAVLSYNFNSNVHYILSEYPTELELYDLNIVIHGFSYYDSELKKSLVDIIEPNTNDGKIHILLAHGGDTNHCPIDFELLANKNFNYCALGHIHQYQDMFDHKIVYPGSLEPLDMQETKEHGICIGDIHPITRRLEKFHFEPMAKAQYITLSIKVKETTTNDDLITSISNEIFSRGSTNIYTLKLEGPKNPDEEFDFSLLNKFRIIEIMDETEPKYNFVALSKEHPKDMVGAYIRAFHTKTEDMSYVQKKALFYGIDALLKSSKSNME